MDLLLGFSVVALVLILVPLLLRGFQRDRPGRVLTLLLAIVGLVWLADLLAVGLDVGGASNFIDCWPNCTTSQDVAGIVAGYGAVLLAVLLLVVALRGAWEILRN